MSLFSKLFHKDEKKEKTNDPNVMNFMSLIYPEQSDEED